MPGILRRLAGIAALGLAIAGTATAVHAETTQCTDVASLAAAPPYKITAQGVYCLQADISFAAVSGAAITIDANNVVLDLNDHKIGGGPAGTGTTAVGVLVNNHGNVIVKNGLVRGFHTGIFYLPGTANNGNIVENILAVANWVYAINIGGPGSNNTVRNCVIGTTGGSTSALDSTAGIYVFSTSSYVTNNTVTNTFVTSLGSGRYGIYLNDGRALNNQIIGDGGDTGTNIGLYMGSGLYKDNVVSRCTIPYSGGIAVGTTNYP
jgi:hypothetical protein